MVDIVKFLKKEAKKMKISEKMLKEEIKKIKNSKNVVLVNYAGICWSIEDEDTCEVIIDQDVMEEMKNL